MLILICSTTVSFPLLFVLGIPYPRTLNKRHLLLLLNIANKDIKKPPKYHNAGTRIGQILQARMRMECSSFNSHLYRKNIVSTPSCQCGGFESPYHFFFQCPRYAAARNRFLPNDINRYNTHDFSFGIEGKTNRKNEALFIKVQDFIVKPGRFAS